MNDKFQKSILQTLAFWDIFDYPLTKEELYHGFLNTDNTDLKVDYAKFLSELESLPGVVERGQGFYFLPDREEIVGIRQSKVKLLEQKLKIARRGIKKLASVPFVRAVFICNTLAMGFPDENSDIDVFIIVKKGRIWLARILATLMLSLFRLRRTKIKIENRICLSFYVSDDNLNLEKIAISQPDIYLVNWINNLIPVYDPNNLHQSFLQANKWAGRYFVNGLQTYEISEKLKVKSEKIGEFFKRFFERVWNGAYGDLIEAQAKGIQLAKMKMNYMSVQNENDTRVIVSDNMLKFHETDKREEYKRQWKQRCEKLNV